MLTIIILSSLIVSWASHAAVTTASQANYRLKEQSKSVMVNGECWQIKALEEKSLLGGGGRRRGEEGGGGGVSIPHVG